MSLFKKNVKMASFGLQQTRIIVQGESRGFFSGHIYSCRGVHVAPMLEVRPSSTRFRKGLSCFFHFVFKIDVNSLIKNLFTYIISIN